MIICYLLLVSSHSQGISWNSKGGIWGEMEESEQSKSNWTMILNVVLLFSISCSTTTTITTASTNNASITQPKKPVHTKIREIALLVQDFLDKAKKDFEEKWAKNPQVSFFSVWWTFSSNGLKNSLSFKTFTNFLYGSHIFRPHLNRI